MRIRFQWLVCLGIHILRGILAVIALVRWSIRRLFHLARRLRRIACWLIRILVRTWYPDDLWLQERRDDRNRRTWRRWSRYPDPGLAFDLIIVLSCAVLAIACLLV